MGVAYIGPSLLIASHCLGGVGGTRCPPPVLTENIFSPCLQIAASHPCNCLSCLCNCVCTELKYLAQLFKSHQAIESSKCTRLFKILPFLTVQLSDWLSHLPKQKWKLVRRLKRSIHCNFCWIDGLFMIGSPTGRWIHTFVHTHATSTSGILVSQQPRFSIDIRYNWEMEEAGDTIGWEEKASIHSVSPRIDWIRWSGLDQWEPRGSCQNPPLESATWKWELPESATWNWELPESGTVAQLEHCSPVCKASIQNIALDQWCGKALCSENCARPTESFLELCSSPWTTDPANEAKDFWQAPQTQLWLTVSATNSSLRLNDSSSLSNTYRRFKLISKGNAKWIQSDLKPKVGLVS